MYYMIFLKGIDLMRERKDIFNKNNIKVIVVQ